LAEAEEPVPVQAEQQLPAASVRVAAAPELPPVRARAEVPVQARVMERLLQEPEAPQYPVASQS
jgi:hypothetical protein